MRLRISGRASDLARIQTHEAARTLAAAWPAIETSFHHRESLGDRMQDEPLWSMPEKGVFTEDFVEDLSAGRTDVVVHSWKDLPTEPRKHTQVAATFVRADLRDVLLVRRDRFAELSRGDRCTILTSSPRRIWNLSSFLEWALPIQGLEIHFEPVRGNVPTRLKKLLEGDEVGLVVAKAALDRLLTADDPEFAETVRVIRGVLDRCHWMALPVRENPTGAAQGALALEIARNRPEIRELIEGVNHSESFHDVERERAILQSYGGGCHQKIGVTILSRSYGVVTSVRGLTEAGQRLDQFTLERAHTTPKTTRDRLWPVDPGQADPFAREQIQAAEPGDDVGFWVARAEALPEGWAHHHRRLVWVAGSKTWKRLAERGVWVNGSAEGLGETEEPRVDAIVGRVVRWMKLTHDGPDAARGLEGLATYRLVPKGEVPELNGVTHFFWTSGSRFLDAVRRQPEILNGWHSCGPGNTREIIRERLGSDDRVDVWLSHSDWMKEVVSI